MQFFSSFINNIIASKGKRQAAILDCLLLLLAKMERYHFVFVVTLIISFVQMGYTIQDATLESNSTNLDGVLISINDRSYLVPFSTHAEYLKLCQEKDIQPPSSCADLLEKKTLERLAEMKSMYIKYKSLQLENTLLKEEKLNKISKNKNKPPQLRDNDSNNDNLYDFHNSNVMQLTKTNKNFCMTDKLINEQAADQIISDIKSLPFSVKIDATDGFPEWQIQVYYCIHKYNCPGFNPYIPIATRNVLEVLMKKIEKEILNCQAVHNKKVQIYWVYIKRYSKDTRIGFPIHVDNTLVTGTIALSNPNTYKGGEYFLLPQNRTDELNVSGDKDIDTSFNSLSERRRKMTEELIETGEFQKHHVKIQQGSGAIHYGSLAHGVLNVSEGVRYSCIFFAKYDDSNDGGRQCD
jgi:hypothetical protein